MAKLSLVAGTTSKILQVFLQDSSSTTGAGLTGLVFNSGSLTAYYHRDTDTTATAITLVTMTVGTFTSSGFKEIDSTNMPGWYQLCPPNAAIASGAKSVAIHLKGATNLAPLPLEIELTATDNQDGVHFGLTSIPNVASGSAGALLVDGTGTAAIANSAGKVLLQATQSGVTIPTVTTVTNQLTAAQVATGVWQDATGSDFTTSSSIGKSLYTTGNAPGAASGIALVGSNMGTASSVTGSVGSVTGAVGSVTGSVGSVTGAVGSVTGAVGSVTAAVTISAGTGAGQLDFTSGVVKANLAQILGTALTETAGQLAGGFKKFFNIATPAATMDHGVLVDTVTTTTTATTATNLTNAATAGDFTATMKTSIGTAVAASAVASVTAGVTLTSSERNSVADALLDRTAGVETSFTPRQTLRLILSSVVAKLSGAATTTVTIRDINDTKARITATVDADGNRTAVSTDVT